MDVVRTNLKKLNGSVGIESHLGRGTVVKLRLPLTLAILPVLLVQVGEEVYALPLRSVVETAQINPKLVHLVEGTEVLSLRGQTLPLLRLQQLFPTGSASRGLQSGGLSEAMDKGQKVVILDGLATLRCIMAQFPRPVIMVSSVTVKDAETTFTALGAGAFDYVPKQLSAASLNILHIRGDLVSKIKAAAESRRSREQRALLRKPPRAVELPRREFASPAPLVIAVGISTGGPKALQEILPTLPADLSVPMLMVQHMPAGFTNPFAHRLNNLCAASVCEASNGEDVRAGVIYIAPGGSHMTVERLNNSRITICLSDKPENQLHVPSVDIMMRSVASAFHSLVMGVIMTGMGSDGVQGMDAIHRAGGFTLGQDETSCAVYGMPRSAPRWESSIEWCHSPGLHTKFCRPRATEKRA